MNIMNGPPPSSNVQDVRVVVTPSPSAPNVIPVGGRVQTQQATLMPFLQQHPHQHQQQQHLQHQQQQHFLGILYTNALVLTKLTC